MIFKTSTHFNILVRIADLHKSFSYNSSRQYKPSLKYHTVSYKYFQSAVRS